METVKLQLKDQSYTLKETLRALKTNIQFCGDDKRVILFTSAVPNEGKSTVVMDLARSLTDSKKSVLVIDADIRKSVLIGRMRAKVINGKEIYGLSHLLSGQKKMSEVIYATEKTGLFMVFAGPSVPNPTEMLEKRYFAELIAFARDQFDYVLIDCPPMGAAIDAAVIAKHCDGSIIVVSQGTVSSRGIVNVKKQLENAGVPILGAVLNKVQMKKNSYYGSYYGGYYGKYYGSYYGHYGNEKDKDEE